MSEVENAIKNLKNGKATEDINIPGELLIKCGTQLIDKSLNIATKYGIQRNVQIFGHNH